MQTSTSSDREHEVQLVRLPPEDAAEAPKALFAELPKQEVKEHLTALADSAITAILGSVPRPLRRSAARMYATEAWRVLTAQPRYRQHLNGAVIAWVVAEYQVFLKKVVGESQETPNAPQSADVP